MKFDVSSYIKEVYRLIFGLITLFMLGFITGYFWAVLAVGLFLYSLWHLYHLRVLIHWISSSELSLSPEPWGIWGDVFHYLYRLRSQQHKRSRKIQTLLERYKEATEAVPDATMILGKRWKIEWLNSKCKSYLGLKPRKDIGKPLTHLLHSPDFIAFL